MLVGMIYFSWYNLKREQDQDWYALYAVFLPKFGANLTTIGFSS